MSTIKQLSNSILTEKNTKIIPENIKKDVQIFDVTGTYEGSGGGSSGVKLFETISAMNSSSGNQEGDIALCYGFLYSPWYNISTDTFYFPENVTLDSEITQNKSASWSDEMIERNLNFILTPTTCTISYEDLTSGESYESVTYTSSDGIHYIRTSSHDSETYYTFNNTKTMAEIQKFIFVGRDTLSGLFQYREDYEEDLRTSPQTPNWVNSELKYDTVTVSRSLCMSIINALGLDFGLIAFKNNECYVYQYSSDNTNWYSAFIFTTFPYDSNTDVYVGSTISTSGTNNVQIKKFTVNLSDFSYTSEVLSTTVITGASGSQNRFAYAEVLSGFNFACYSQTYENTILTTCKNPNGQLTSVYYGNSNEKYKVTKYFNLPSQLTNFSSSSLQAGEIALGLNGVVVGSGSLNN